MAQPARARSARAWRCLAEAFLDPSPYGFRADADLDVGRRVASAERARLAARRPCQPCGDAGLVFPRLHSQGSRLRAGRSCDHHRALRPPLDAAEPLAPAAELD